MITFRTHCSGGELFGVGARQAGFRHVDGFEISDTIAGVARLNGFAVRSADVCQVEYESLPMVDHFHTSPSCKRASRANTQAGETADDLAVADSVVRAIRAHQGRTFSLENVIEYRWFESYDRIVQALRDSGFVFRVVAKGGEWPRWGQSWRVSKPVWNDAGEFVDAADFGVPQNRKRLILRAVRGADRLPGLRPTHSKRGGVLLDRWNGWYGAIADLIDDLPPTTPAKWQLARMPKELRETLLIGQGGYEGRIGQFAIDEPAPTMTANRNHQQLRAFLLGDQRAGASDSVAPRAYIIGGGNTGWEKVTSQARTADEPMFTIRNGRNGSPERAFLLSGENGGQEWGKGYRDEGEPAHTISGSTKGTHRAYTAGRWVRMDIRALGRFQSVPDDYQGLTPEINGNGVPCRLARHIMESLRGVYEQ